MSLGQGAEWHVPMAALVSAETTSPEGTGLPDSPPAGPFPSFLPSTQGARVVSWGSERDGEMEVETLV